MKRPETQKMIFAASAGPKLRDFLGGILCLMVAVVQFLFAAPEVAQADCFGYKTLFVSRVQGRVFDQMAEPVTNVEVSLMRDGNVIGMVRTDANGRFTIKAVDGEYKLYTKAPGFMSAYAVLNVGSDLMHALHPSNLWLILGVGAGIYEPCPSSTTSHRQFLQIIRQCKQRFQEIDQNNATQK